MKQHSVMALVVAFVCAWQFASAGTNDTARINASIIPMIQIGGSSAPGDPDDPTNGNQVAQGNNLGGVIAGIAYGQSYTALDSGANNSFVATGSWLIHSNTQVNKFACSGTDLYKGAVNPAIQGDYNTQPIALDFARGAILSASLSNDLSGREGFSEFTGDAVPDSSNPNWVFKKSAFVSFHGAQQQVTQWVNCKLTWTNHDLEKSQGVYVGYMRIYAMNGDHF